MDLVPAKDIPKGQPFDISNLKAVDELYYVMAKEIEQRKNAVGLSAVQLGLPHNVFVIRYRGANFFFLNASYHGFEPVVGGEEECLSLPGKKYWVNRSFRIKVDGYIYDPKKKAVLRVDRAMGRKRVFFYDMLARIVQHEIDHQLGILISDIGADITENYEN